MIQTSNFETHSRVHFKNPVSIALGPGKEYSGRAYPKLMPPSDLFQRYHVGLVTPDEFAREYRWRVLSKLNPVLVAEELGADATLLCHEKDDKFCHRHVVAVWFTEHGIPVTEYTENRCLSEWFD